MLDLYSPKQNAFSYVTLILCNIIILAKYNNCYLLYSITFNSTLKEKTDNFSKKLQKKSCYSLW